MDKEFIETCMSKRTKEVEPSVAEISNPVMIGNIANSHKTLSHYFLKGAQSILKSDTPLLAILLGYFSMEQSLIFYVFILTPRCTLHCSSKCHQQRR